MNDAEKGEMPEHIDSPVLKISHSNLMPIDDGAYKRACPVCEDGVLLVNRNPETFEIEKYDRCVVCGQLVEYLDYKKLVNNVILIK